MKRIALSLLGILIGFSLSAATCTFNGSGDGSSWTDALNWSCGSVPDPSSDDIIIPSGFNVINDAANDIDMDNGHDLTIDGSLDMRDAKITISQAGSILNMAGTGKLIDCKELFFTNVGVGNIDFGAMLDVDHVKVDDHGMLTLNSCSLTIGDKLEVLSSGSIVGGGQITYNGSSGNYVNTSSGGIFGCTSPTFGDCNLGTCSVVLAVELTSFEGVQNDDNSITIQWTTASEEDNDYFDLERSYDLQNWETIGSEKGAGNSTTSVSYAMRDLPELSNVVYYRLKQVDFDGKVNYSKIIAIHLNSTESNTTIKAFPNPARDFVVVQGNMVSLNSIGVYNLIGEEITKHLSMSQESKNSVSINVADLVPGTYLVKTLSGTARIVVHN